MQWPQQGREEVCSSTKRQQKCSKVQNQEHSTKISYHLLFSSGSAQLMQAGVFGLHGAPAVATVERTGHKCPSGQGQGPVIQLSLEERIALTLNSRQEEPTWWNKTVLTYQSVPGLPNLVLGENGQPVLKAATKRATLCLSRRGKKPAYQNPVQGTLD